MNLNDSPRNGRVFDIVRSTDSYAEPGVAKRPEASATRASRRNEALKGAVSIAAPQGLGVHWLAKRLPLFNRWYPNVKVTLRVELPTTDLARNTVDATLSVGDHKGQDLVGRVVSRTRFGLYASDRYLADRGHPVTAGQLVGHSVVSLQGTFEHLPEVVELRERIGSAVEVVRCDSVCAQLMAARAGVGIAPLPGYMVEDSPELMRVLPNAFGAEVDVWLHTHPDVTARPRIQAFVDWLTVELAGNDESQSASYDAYGNAAVVLN